MLFIFFRGNEKVMDELDNCQDTNYGKVCREEEGGVGKNKQETVEGDTKGF